MTSIPYKPTESLAEHIARADAIVEPDTPVKFTFENFTVIVALEVCDDYAVRRVSIVPRFNVTSLITRARALRNSIRS